MKILLVAGSQLSLGRHLVELKDAVVVEIAAQSKDEVAEILADTGANYALNRENLEHTEEVREGNVVKSVKVTYGLHGRREVEVISQRIEQSEAEKAESDRLASTEKAQAQATAELHAREIVKALREDSERARAGEEQEESRSTPQAVPAAVESATETAKEPPAEPEEAKEVETSEPSAPATPETEAVN
jgi:hypothetical protein